MTEENYCEGETIDFDESFGLIANVVLIGVMSILLIATSIYCVMTRIKVERQVERIDTTLKRLDAEKVDYSFARWYARAENSMM